MSQPIRADYPHMEAAVASMREISTVIDSKLDTLRKELQEVKWVGSAEQAWRMHQAEWDSAIAELNNLLNMIAMKVGEARQNYLDTEHTVARTWNNASIGG
jgi:WXG100 family type VII secretion target